MKKTTKVIASFCILAIGGLVVAFTTFSDELMPQKDTQLEEALVLESVDQKTEGEEVVVEDMFVTTESAFMEVIHHMTHQKVEANPKWGAIEISKKRIQDMLAVLDANELKNEEFYRETLNAWEKGDFSNAVAVHNKIWKMQHGTIGEATDLLNEKEEADYIEKHFE